jgi:hypothetical protein
MAALGLALCLLAGCGSPGTSPSASPTASVSAVCSASAAYSAALTNFKDTLKSGATLEQIRSARDQVRSTFDALVAAASDVAKDRVDAVKAAQQKFAAAVDAVPNSATLSQAVSSLRDEAENVQKAVSDLTTEIKC